MAEVLYDGTTIYCVMCGTAIPEERRRFKAVTCTEEHGKAYAEAKRKHKEGRECPICRKPSTPEDREAYKEFRKLLRKQPHLLHPRQYNAWIEDQMTLAQANKDPKVEFPATPEAFAKHWNAAKINNLTVEATGSVH